MRIALLSYCIGILCGVFFAELRSGSYYAGLFLLVGGLLALPPRLSRYSKLARSAKFLGGVSCAAAAGLAWHMFWAQGILSQRLPLALEGQDLLLSGTVISLPDRNARAQQFHFRTNNDSLVMADRRLLLNYYGDSEIAAGQNWQFLVRLNRPRGFANPASFDYEAWLFQQGVHAKGYVRSGEDNRRLAGSSASLAAGRSLIKTRFLSLTEDLPHAGILLALAIGDKSEIDPKQWQMLTGSGLNHLFVISGLHLAMLAAAAYWLARAVIGFVPGLMLRIPAQKLAALIALLAVSCYALLAGMSLPTQRAWLMVAVFMLAYVSDRLIPVSHRYLLALAVVLSLNPLAVLSPGFWFSFIAVATLLMFATGQDSHEEPAVGLCSGSQVTEAGFNVRAAAMRLVRPQFLVFIALSLPLLMLSQRLPLLSPLINIVAIPFVGMLIVPLVLAAVFMMFVHSALAQLMLTIADRCLALLLGALELLHREFPAWTQLSIPYPLWPALLCAGVAVILLLLPSGVARRWLVMPLLLPLFWPALERRDPAILSVHVLDVGQGLAVIVQSATHNMVFDTGAKLGPDFDLGSAVVVPVLRYLGIRQLDTVIISHADNDHAGGLLGLLDGITTASIYSSATDLPVGGIVSGKPPPVQPCHAPQSWRWDGIEFRFLNTPQALASTNDNSCVLQIVYPGGAVLLPGDIERLGERSLALDYGAGLGSTILLAAHHGSKSSSSYTFIKHVAPHLVVFSAGYRNSFGHPDPAISRRFEAMGASTEATYATGMLSFSIDTDSGELTQAAYRELNPRYWR